jgi:hypothetical protein
MLSPAPSATAWAGKHDHALERLSSHHIAVQPVGWLKAVLAAWPEASAWRIPAIAGPARG